MLETRQNNGCPVMSIKYLVQPHLRNIVRKCVTAEALTKLQMQFFQRSIRKTAEAASHKRFILCRCDMSGMFKESDPLSAGKNLSLFHSQLPS